jgi:hypothetical protein
LFGAEYPIEAASIMRIDPNSNPTPPSNPYHIARAYGVRPGGQVGQSGAVAGAAPVKPERPAPKLPTAAQALVAAVVPGGVEFREGAAGVHAGGEAQPSPPAFQMYKHPAEKNAAATAVQVGKRLDVQG